MMALLPVRFKTGLGQCRRYNSQMHGNSLTHFKEFFGWNHRMRIVVVDHKPCIMYFASITLPTLTPQIKDVVDARNSSFRVIHSCRPHESTTEVPQPRIYALVALGHSLKTQAAGRQYP